MFQKSAVDDKAVFLFGTPDVRDFYVLHIWDLYVKYF